VTDERLPVERPPGELWISAGWLHPARHLPSPNCDARPPGVEVDLLVLHGLSLPPGEHGGPYIDQLFCNCLDVDAHPDFGGLRDLRVSAHLLIRREGDITQYVPFDLRAWHAGVSEHQGRRACNDFSIGIELEGSDETPYTGQQYARLGAVAAVLMAEYPRITPERIVGHSDIAPGRKSDPGPAFDWGRLRRELAAGRGRGSRPPHHP
jgi:N-acetyl-anhydromuramoyl-L-alanine amidase